MRSQNLRKVDFFQEKAAVLKVVDTGRLKKMRELSETRKKMQNKTENKALFLRHTRRQ